MWEYIVYVANIFSNFQICFFLHCHCLYLKACIASYVNDCNFDLLYWSWFYLPKYPHMLFPKWSSHFLDRSPSLTHIIYSLHFLSEHVRPFMISPLYMSPFLSSSYSQMCPTTELFSISYAFAFMFPLPIYTFIPAPPKYLSNSYSCFKMQLRYYFLILFPLSLLLISSLDFLKNRCSVLNIFILSAYYNTWNIIST